VHRVVIVVRKVVRLQSELFLIAVFFCFGEGVQSSLKQKPGDFQKIKRKDIVI